MMNKATRVLTAAAVGALWVGTMALTAPQPELVQGTPHAAVRIEEDQPGWNCHTMGNHICGPDLAHEDTSDTACWVEKTTGPTAEVICGARGLRPNGSVDMGTVFGPGCGWVAVMNADGPVIEPAGCN